RVQVAAVGAVREAPNGPVERRSERGHELRALVVGVEVVPRVVLARQRLEHRGERPADIYDAADLVRGPRITVSGPIHLDVRDVADSRRTDEGKRSTRCQNQDSDAHERSEAP